MYYSKSTGGFYDASIHGARTIEIVDPSFEWPQIEVKSENEGSEESTDGSVSHLVNDPDVIPPMIEVVNPDCKIPSDAVEISIEEHTALLEAQAQGKVISWDEKTKKPVAKDPKPLSSSEIAKQRISELEASITPRRIREAVLGTDNGWLADVNSQIEALRSEL